MNFFCKICIKKGESLFKPAACFTLLENMNIWYKIHVIIYLFAILYVIQFKMFRIHKTKHKFFYDFTKFESLILCRLLEIHKRFHVLKRVFLLTTLGTFTKLWLVGLLGWMFKRFSHYFKCIEGAILSVITADVFLFIGHCLITLDPCELIVCCQERISSISNTKIFRDLKG